MIAPGTKVRLTPPPDSKHIRRGQVGVVRAVMEYVPPVPRPKPGYEPRRKPESRWLAWVDYPDCPHNEKGAFGSPAWLEELTVL